MRHPLDLLLVLGWMVLVELAVRVLPLSRLAAALGAPLATTDERPTCGAPARLRQKERRRLVLVDALGRRWPFGSGPCLRQALVAGHVLRRHSPVLRVGATLENGEVVGHAWVELGAEQLGSSEGFAVLVSSPQR